jgi:hypothetical protein
MTLRPLSYQDNPELMPGGSGKGSRVTHVAVRECDDTLRNQKTGHRENSKQLGNSKKE